MDALDRILPLAGLLWPLADCDASIRRDISGAQTINGVSYLARVFDADGHPDADPLADASGPTPTAAADALARHLATLARPRLDVLLRAAGVSPSQRADLAADVARLERAVSDLTRDRDRAHRLAVEDATARQQLISDLSIARSERDRLRAELDRQAAHRAAGDAVDLAAAVRHEAHCMEWIARVTESHTIRDAMADRAARLREVLARCGYLRGEAVESGEQEAVEGAGGHGASVATGSATGKARVE